jgi:anti-sigma factor RsiW
MKKSESGNLRDLGWRTKLSAKEEAWLAANPEADAHFREEQELTQLLGRLPDAPVSSNFTSQVLRRVELEQTKISREHKRGWPAWRVGFGWVSRLAIAGFVFAAGVFGLQRYGEFTQRSELAHSVGIVSQVATVPTEWLEDFETISRLNVSAPVDQELLAMLQ